MIFNKTQIQVNDTSGFNKYDKIRIGNINTIYTIKKIDSSSESLTFYENLKNNIFKDDKVYILQNNLEYTINKEVLVKSQYKLNDSENFKFRILNENDTSNYDYIVQNNTNNTNVSSTIQEGIYDIFNDTLSEGSQNIINTMNITYWGKNCIS